MTTEILQAFVGASQLVFGNAGFFVSMFAGALAGIILGIVPAIGAMLGCALFLPFAFMLRPETALPFMVGILSTSRTAGSITSVVLGIPGDTVNAATILDGYPMSQRGEAGRGVGAALMSSGMGSLVTVIVALAIVPLVLPFVMAIRTADIVFLVLLGISFIAVLGRGAMLKGLVSGGVGLLLGTVGFQAVTGVPRFTFGSVYLYEGFDMVAVALGLFAVPAVLAMVAGGGTIARSAVALGGMRGVFQGVRDVFVHWGLFIRSSIIGFIIGVLPGIGGTAASFIAYGQAKATSKHPEKFGTGAVEGVVAPESANNACLTGDVLITLALGIPGSASMVLMLAAFYMVGLVPGPRLLTEHFPLALSLLLAVLVANVIAVVICFLAAPPLARMAFIPARILAPLVVLIVYVGAFATNERFNDVIVTFVFGLLGLVMMRFGFNRAALLLGFIMEPLFEQNLFVALGVAGPLFFLRPISLSLIAINIALFAYEPISRLVRRKQAAKTT